MSVSTLFECLNLRRTDVGRAGLSEGGLSHLHRYRTAALCGFLALEVTDQPSSLSNTDTSVGLSQTISRPVTPTTPLFYVGSPSPELTSSTNLQTTLADYEDPLPPSYDEPPLSPSDETQVAEEIRREYSWLRVLLAQNEAKVWGTAYRDFVEVKLLLFAVRGMGIEEVGNNRLAKGVFQSSMGGFTLSVWDFIDVLQLTHSSGTWRNKVTAYFRIKQLYMFAQYNHGGIWFQSREHCLAWDAVRCWMDNQNDVLGSLWETTRYGSKELRPLLQHMVAEVSHGAVISSQVIYDADVENIKASVDYDAQRD